MGVAAKESSPSGASTTADQQRSSRPRKALTIGAVCKILGQEFGDISISKIRYLEDQKLLAPVRTSGGYRLYSQADVERLRAILRMQRDEFLPLRVIRQELSRSSASSGRGIGSGGLKLDEALEQTQAKARLVRELEEYGLLNPTMVNGDPVYDEADLEIIKAAAGLAQFGVEGRNLRHFATSADRESALLEQILAPGLRSRSKERRQEAVESLQTLAGACARMRHQLLVQRLRRLTE